MNAGEKLKVFSACRSRATDTPSCLAPEEVNEGLGLRFPLVRQGIIERLLEVSLVEKHLVKGFLHILPGGGIHAGTTHPNDIQPANSVRVGDDHIGRHILADAGISLDHAKTSDSHKLVQSGTASEEGSITEDDVTSQHTLIGEDVALSNDAVMPYVGSDHEVVVRSDFRNAVLRGASVNRDVLPKCVSWADANFAGDSTVEAQILGSTANDGVASDEAVVANFGVREHLGMTFEGAAIANLRTRFHHRKTSDLSIFANLSCGIDESGGVNLQIRMEGRRSWNLAARKGRRKRYRSGARDRSLPWSRITPLPGSRPLCPRHFARR